MKSLAVGVVVVLASLVARSQVTTTGVPSLLITYSAESNGMGGVGFGRPSEDPANLMRNAGLVGFQSLDTRVSTSFYTHKVAWLPQFGLHDLNLDSYSASAGINLKGMLALPFDVGIGFGYSNVKFNLGTFSITLNDPTPLRTFDEWEDARTLCVGIGIDFGIRLGMGWGSTSIRSALGSSVTPGNPSISDTAQATATQWGVLIQAPIAEFLYPTKGPTNGATLSPIFNLNFGYALNNIGDRIVYKDALQGDPLPRQIGIGYSIDIGVRIRGENSSVTMVCASYSHDAEDLLVERDTTGKFWYASGLHNINVLDNVIGGNTNSKIVQRTGWQINFFDIFSAHEGRWDGNGYPIVTTKGYMIQSKGVFELLHLAIPGNLLLFASKHLDLRYNFSEYFAPIPLDQTKFEGVTIVIHI